MNKKNKYATRKKLHRVLKNKKLDLDQIVPEFVSIEEEKPLGHLDMLPTELKFMIFSNLNALDLSYLTITSKCMRNMVEVYRKTDSGQRNILSFPYIHSQDLPIDEVLYMQQFKHIGLLLKRLTCLYSTSDRLVLILSFLHKFQCNFNNDCVSVQKCIALNCYGMVLQTVLAGWDDKEWIKAFDTVCSTSYMKQFLDFLVKKKEGTFSELETHVRLFFRRVFLHNNNKTEKAFWLDLILKPFPSPQQAHIIYMLFGPSSKDGIQWLEVCESTPSNEVQTLLCFGNISNALLLLHNHFPIRWNEDCVINIIEKLIDKPEEWLSENIASLLYLCGEKLTLRFLIRKARDDKISELSYMITSFCLVCIKQNQQLTWVLGLIEGICNSIDSKMTRKVFLQSVIDMHREVVLDVLEFEETLDDETSRDLHVLLNAQNSFCKEIICMAYKHLLTD